MVTLSWIPNDAAGWLGFLVGVSARGAVVLALAALVCLAWHRASAALRHFIWTLAISCVLCLPLFSLALPTWRVRGIPRLLAPSTGLARQPIGLPGPGRPEQDTALMTAAAASVPKSSAAPTLAANRAQGSTGRPTSGSVLRERIPLVALVVWALGGLIALLPVLVGLVCVARLVKQSRRVDDDSWGVLMRDASAQLRLHRPVKLLCSPLETVPMICGWWRPVLLLPAGAEGWTEERRRLVLLHELAHAKRGDCLTQLLGQFARALYWFNPLVWLALQRLRREREQACDDLVLRSGFRGSEYAGHLLNIAKLLQPVAFAQAVAIVISRPAGIESRIRALLDPRRSRRGVTRPAALLAALVAAALLVALASARGASATGADQHQLGVREQWQPQTMPADPRLDKPVHIEILGRAAVPALALLSAQTGVALQVAPEDTETVGERKFTVIAQGCSLKAIMVQLPKALQECHWDIDLTGKEPAYLLHRNGSVEATMLQLMDEEPLHLQAEGRPAREARVTAARKALAMSPEELDELAKTDLYLARSVEDAKCRSLLDLFLSLPQDQMKQYVDTGMAPMAYSSAPKHFREAADRLLQESREESMAKDGAGSLSVKIADVVLDDIEHATIQYEDDGDGGTFMRIFAFDKKGDRYSWGVVRALWPQYASTNRDWYHSLPLAATSDEKSSDTLAQEWARKGAAEYQSRRQEKRRLEWREPRNRELHREVALPFTQPVEPVEVQRFVAKETGLSLVSDYFTTWGPRKIPEEARASMQIWRLIYLLGEQWFWTYDWNEAGDCLVFHDRQWYSRALQECPESLIATYREKLEKQGAFTLDDVVAFAVALERHRPRDPILRQMGVMIPRDLLQAGLSGVSFFPEGLLIYASLTAEQRAKARSAEGLPYAEMTRAQQELVRRSGGERYGGSPHHEVLTPAVPEEEMVKAVFRITQSRMTVGKPGPGDLAAAGTYDQIGLSVQFPNRETGSGVTLPSPKPAAAGGS